MYICQIIMISNFDSNVEYVKQTIEQILPNNYFLYHIIDIALQFKQLLLNVTKSEFTWYAKDLKFYSAV